MEARGVCQTDLTYELSKSGFNMVNHYAANRVQPPIPILYDITNIVEADVGGLLLLNNKIAI